MREDGRSASIDAANGRNRGRDPISNVYDLHDGDGLLDLVKTSLDDDKAEDLIAIDVAGRSSITDHMVVASGRSSRQVVAMAEHLVEKLKHHGVKSVQVEGLSQGDWVLIDAGDVLVHLFRPEVREFYAIEKMWVPEDAPSVQRVRVGGGTPMALA